MSNLNNDKAMPVESVVAEGYTWHIAANGYWLVDDKNVLRTLKEVFPADTVSRDRLKKEGHSIANGLGYEF